MTSYDFWGFTLSLFLRALTQNSFICTAVLIRKWMPVYFPLQWRHEERDGVSNYRRLHYLLNRLLRRRSKITSKLRVIGLCERNSPVTGEFLHKGPVAGEKFQFHDVIMLHFHVAVITYVPSPWMFIRYIIPRALKTESIHEATLRSLAALQVVVDIMATASLQQ